MLGRRLHRALLVVLPLYKCSSQERWFYMHSGNLSSLPGVLSLVFGTHARPSLVGKNGTGIRPRLFIYLSQTICLPCQMSLAYAEPSGDEVCRTGFGGAKHPLGQRNMNLDPRLAGLTYSSSHIWEISMHCDLLF